VVVGSTANNSTKYMIKKHTHLPYPDIKYI
jgi:hypothetical protein